jgi:hypothetical protein
MRRLVPERRDFRSRRHAACPRRHPPPVPGRSPRRRVPEGHRLSASTPAWACPRSRTLTRRSAASPFWTDASTGVRRIALEPGARPTARNQHDALRRPQPLRRQLPVLDLNLKRPTAPRHRSPVHVPARGVRLNGQKPGRGWRALSAARPADSHTLAIRIPYAPHGLPAAPQAKTLGNPDGPGSSQPGTGSPFSRRKTGSNSFD